MDFGDSNAVAAAAMGVCVGVVGCCELVSGEQWRSEIRVKREGVDDERLNTPTGRGFSEQQWLVMRVDTREKSSDSMVKSCEPYLC